MRHTNHEQKKSHENQIKLLLLGRAAPKDDGGTISRNYLRQLLPLDNERVKIASSTSSCPTVFPFDIWLELFLFLDVKTLTLLRCVCKSFRNMISNYPRYSMLYHNVPYLLRASLVTGTGSFTSLKQLHKAYLSTQCTFEACTNNAEYIYLVKADRICSVHLREIKLVAMTRELKQAISVSGTAPANLPLIYPVMQMLTRTSYIEEKILALLSQTKALLALTATISATISGTGYGQHCLKSCVKTPWFDGVTKKNYWGYRCNSCANGNADIEQQSNLTYTSEGMLKHFEDCPAARARWHNFVAKND